MINGATQQVITLYETQKLTVPQICASFGGEYDETAIIAILSQFSVAYRREHRAGEERAIGFSSSQEQRACDVIVSLLDSEESDSIRLKAAMFVRDDKQGRRDTVAKLANFGLQIQQFQELIQQSNKALGLHDIDRKAIEDRKHKPSASTKFVEVEAEVVGMSTQAA